MMISTELFEMFVLCETHISVLSSTGGTWKYGDSDLNRGGKS